MQCPTLPTPFGAWVRSTLQVSMLRRQHRRPVEQGVRPDRRHRVSGGYAAGLACRRLVAPGQFAYQVGISPLPFFCTVVGPLLVAIVAASTQAVSAARIDPATVLRAE